MKFIKTIFISMFLLLIASGCKHNEYAKIDYNTNATTNSIMKSSNFNQETFIWQSFQFPNNRTK